jgi:hypothetical protein
MQPRRFPPEPSLSPERQIEHAMQARTTWSVCQAALLAGVFLAPVPAAAQGDSFAKVSFASTQTYDGNLFATSRDQASDAILRFGPAFEAGYFSLPFSFVARYAVDAERYQHHSELDRNVARQDAAIELHQFLTRRVRLNVVASYLETRNAREFNLTTGLAARLAPARRFVARPGLTYEMTSRTQLGLDYQLAKDELAGSTSGEVQVARVGVNRRIGARTTTQLGYRFRHFSFGDGEVADAHLVTFGWKHEFSRVGGLELTAGPRLYEGVLRPEVSASWYYRLKRSELFASYARTQSTSIGQSGAIDGQHLAVGVQYGPVRRLTMTLSPSMYRTSDVLVYGLDVDAAARLGRHVSLVGSAQIGTQHGTLSGGDAAIPNRVFSLKLATTFPGPSRIDRLRLRQQR